VTWHYNIGLDDDGDLCYEHRVTHANADGLVAASFGPGQLGSGTFNLLELPRLNMRVSARRRRGSEWEPIATALQQVEIELGSNRFRSVALFLPALVDEDFVWRVSYRWPGLWRSLRAHGHARGSLALGDSPSYVTTAEVVLSAAVSAFPDLDLVPATEVGNVRRQVDRDRIDVRWIVPQPPPQIQFEITALSRAVR
jgi:hypothetical protein